MKGEKNDILNVNTKNNLENEENSARRGKIF